jgi:hypothetical protein
MNIHCVLGSHPDFIWIQGTFDRETRDSPENAEIIGASSYGEDVTLTGEQQIDAMTAICRLGRMSESHRAAEEASMPNETMWTHRKQKEDLDAAVYRRAIERETIN